MNRGGATGEPPEVRSGVVADPTPLAGRLRAVLLTLVVALGVNVLAAVVVTEQVRTSVDAAERATTAQGAASRLQQSVLEQQSADRGYLVTGDEEYLEAYRAARETQHLHEETLDAVVGDDPDDAALLAEVVDAARQWNAYADLVVAAAPDGRQAAADVMTTGDGARLSEQFRSRMDRLQTRLDTAERRATDLIETRQEWLVRVLAGTLLVCVLLLLLGIRLTGAVAGMRARLLLESSAAARRDLLVGQEEERRQLASGIHDDTIQAAVAAALRLQRLRRHLADSDGRAAELLDQVDVDLSEAIHRLRRMVFELHPPTLDEQGLQAAVRLYLQETAEPHGLTWQVSWSGDDPEDPAVCSVAYRLFREAVWNVIKHAGATTIQVTSDSDPERLVVCVADDGRGFDPDAVSEPRPGHLGLAGSRQLARAGGGTFEVTAVPGNGTSVRYVLPQTVR